MLIQQVIPVDSSDAIVTQRPEVNLTPEAIGTSGSYDDQVGSSPQTQKAQDEEERPHKLHFPVPEVNMSHSQVYQQNTHESTAEREN